MTTENPQLISELLESELDASLCIRIEDEWRTKKGKFYLVHLHHRNTACEPLISCDGIVTTFFELRNKKKEKQSVCRGCEKEVKVNIPILKIQLNLIPES